MLMPSSIDSVLSSVKSECDFILQLLADDGDVVAIVVAEPSMERFPKAVESKLSKAGLKLVESEHGAYYLFEKNGHNHANKTKIAKFVQTIL